MACDVAVIRAIERMVKEVPVHAAGGPVRDWLLGRTAADLDLVVPSGAVGLARRFAGETGGRFVLLDEGEGVARIVFPDLILDFSQYRGGATTIEADLAERDFTVNALAVPAALVPGILRRVGVPERAAMEAAVIDPRGGLEDLARGVIRAISRRNLIDDPLRLLRAFRFRAQLSFGIDPGTLAWIGELRAAISRVSPERISHELDLILETDFGARTFQEMADCGLLFVLLPELSDMDGVGQPGFHHLDVLGHSLETLRAVEQLSISPEEKFCVTAPLEGWLASRDGGRVALKWAGLLHDLGKPSCKAEKDGRATFYHHDSTGARMAESTGGRLRWPRRRIQLVSRLVGLHMRPFHLLNDLRRGGPSRRAMRRLLVQAGEDFPALFLLAMADTLAGCGPLKPPDLEDQVSRLWERVHGFYIDHFLPAEKGERLVTGDDIRKIFSLPPGPLIGKALDAVADARAEGTVTTREEALRFLRNFFENQLPLSDPHG